MPQQPEQPDLAQWCEDSPAAPLSARAQQARYRPANHSDREWTDAGNAIQMWNQHVYMRGARKAMAGCASNRRAHVRLLRQCSRSTDPDMRAIDAMGILVAICVYARQKVKFWRSFRSFLDAEFIADMLRRPEAAAIRASLHPDLLTRDEQRAAAARRIINYHAGVWRAVAATAVQDRSTLQEAIAWGRRTTEQAIARQASKSRSVTSEHRRYLEILELMDRRRLERDRLALQQRTALAQRGVEVFFAACGSSPRTEEDRALCVVAELALLDMDTARRRQEDGQCSVLD